MQYEISTPIHQHVTLTACNADLNIRIIIVIIQEKIYVAFSHK